MQVTFGSLAIPVPTYQVGRLEGPETELVGVGGVGTAMAGVEGAAAGVGSMGGVVGTATLSYVPYLHKAYIYRGRTPDP